MGSGGCVATYPGCVGGEKHSTPPMQPGYKASGCVQVWWVCLSVVGMYKASGCVQVWWVCTRLVGVVKSDGLALVLFMAVLCELEL